MTQSGTLRLQVCKRLMTPKAHESKTNAVHAVGLLNLLCSKQYKTQRQRAPHVAREAASALFTARLIPHLVACLGSSDPLIARHAANNLRELSLSLDQPDVCSFPAMLAAYLTAADCKLVLIRAMVGPSLVCMPPCIRGSPVYLRILCPIGYTRSGPLHRHSIINIQSTYSL